MNRSNLIQNSRNGWVMLEIVLTVLIVMIILPFLYKELSYIKKAGNLMYQKQLLVEKQCMERTTN